MMGIISLSPKSSGDIKYVNIEIVIKVFYSNSVTLTFVLWPLKLLDFFAIFYHVYVFAIDLVCCMVQHVCPSDDKMVIKHVRLATVVIIGLSLNNPY